MKGDHLWVRSTDGYIRCAICNILCDSDVDPTCRKAVPGSLAEKITLAPGGVNYPVPGHATPVVSDGSTASYYELPPGARQLQDLISHCDMNAQIGEIFRACYRYGRAAHSPRLRDAKKIKFYIEAEIARLERLEGGPTDER